MVKVHKPIPKTIKTGGHELKKTQFKSVKPNSTKGAAKKVKNTELVDTDKAENGKTKGGNLTKKNELGIIKEAVGQKKSFVQKSLKNGEAKKTPALKKVAESIRNIESKKKTATAKDLQPVEHCPAVEEMTTKAKKSASKKNHVGLKLQQVSKKSIAKKSSPLEEQVEKDLPKKKQVVAKVQQPVEEKFQQLKKKPVKKASTEHEKEISQKKPIVNKAQEPVKKSIAKKNPSLVEVLETVKNVIPKKKLMTPNVQDEQKSGKEVQSKAEKDGQKKLNSKIQKKLSTEKKKNINLKKKLQKNVDKILQNDQDEIVKMQETKAPLYDPETFDEDKFRDIVSLENIKKVCKALKAVVEKEVSEKKTSVFSDYSYFLNVASYKIPNCPKRMVKLNLTHALVDTSLDDVVLIVPDLQRGARVDYEPTIQHYDDLLRQYEIENIKVMPFNQLRNEYSSFEAKRKLSNTYDHFLCDGRIVGHVVGFCGKNFQKPRTTIHAVKLTNPKTYKREIEHALKRTSFRQIQKGDLSSILVGNHRFTEDQLAENIVKVIEQLKAIYPGSYANIRNMHIKIDIRGTSALPVYVSLTGPPDDVPNIIGPREQRMIKLKKQANEVLSKFSMSKTGDFIKLSQAQVKRKQEIRETREALTSKENLEDNEHVDKLESPLKKKLKKQVEPQKPEESDDDIDETGTGSDGGVEVSEGECGESDELSDGSVDVSEEESNDDEEESED